MTYLLDVLGLIYDKQKSVCCFYKVYKGMKTHVMLITTLLVFFDNIKFLIITGWIMMDFGIHR